MFFILSKLFQFLAGPTHLALLACALGLILSATRHKKAASLFGGVGAALLLLIGFSPIPALLITPLEMRFAPPPADAPAPDGIIVLGGAMDEKSSAFHNQLVLNDAAERLIAPLQLRRLYPHARIVFTGGSAALRGSSHTEAEYVRKLWTELSLDQGGVIYEDRSRNTYENAILTQALVRPTPGERWLLVTSAAHMPRAIGIFRKAGFPVVAYPVDYRIGEDFGDRLLHPAAADNFQLAEIAAHEWAGLLAYWLTGKTEALYPAP